MVRWKRLFYYLSINVFISACTTLSVLFLWEKYNPPLYFDFANFSLEEISQSVIPALKTPVPQLQPSLEPTPGTTPTRSLGDYLVLRGDTLSDIAEKYEVTMEELMEINNIENPDSLMVGQILWVPQPVPAPAQLEVVQSPVSTPVPTEKDDENGEVVIVNVVGAGDLGTERVRLEYRGDGEYSMQGWKLQSEVGFEFVFPMLTLFPGGAIDVFTKGGIDSVVSLFWGLEGAVWNSNNVVLLLDQNDIIRSTFRVP